MLPFPGSGLLKITHPSRLLLYLVYTDGNGSSLMTVKAGRPEGVFYEHVREIYRLQCGFIRAGGKRQGKEKDVTAILHIIGH